MNNKIARSYIRFHFNHPLWNEAVVLEYVLTQGYSDNIDRDTDRLIELSSIIENDWENELEKYKNNNQ